MSACLFVGGCAAGETLEVPEYANVWRVPDYKGSTDEFLRAQVYVEQRFATPNRRHRFFAPEGWTADQAFEELVRGYKP